MGMCSNFWRSIPRGSRTLPETLHRRTRRTGKTSLAARSAGSIIKDKLFFFGDAQLNRQSQGGSVLTTVPTAAERTGNLSDWLAASSNYQIYDPATGNQTTASAATLSAITSSPRTA